MKLNKVQLQIEAGYISLSSEFHISRLQDSYALILKAILDILCSAVF